MALTACASIIKYGIFIFNLLCTIMGAILIYLGASTLNHLEQVKEELPDMNPIVLPVLILILGIIVFCISFLGCCGAIYENRCMLIAYAITLLIIIAAQIIVAGTGLAGLKKSADVASNEFEKIWADRTHAKERKQIDKIQKVLHCCGFNGPSDWGLPPPASCCRKNNCNAPNSLYNEGCGQTIHDLITTTLALISNFAFGFSGVELVALIFSCCLAHAIRNDYEQFV